MLIITNFRVLLYKTLWKAHEVIEAKRTSKSVDIIIRWRLTGARRLRADRQILFGCHIDLIRIHNGWLNKVYDLSPFDWRLAKVFGTFWMFSYLLYVWASVCFVKWFAEMFFFFVYRCTKLTMKDVSTSSASAFQEDVRYFDYSIQPHRRHYSKLNIYQNAVCPVIYQTARSKIKNWISSVYKDVQVSLHRWIGLIITWWIRKPSGFGS